MTRNFIYRLLMMVSILYTCKSIRTGPRAAIDYSHSTDFRIFILEEDSIIFTYKDTNYSFSISTCNATISPDSIPRKFLLSQLHNNDSAAIRIFGARDNYSAAYGNGWTVTSILDISEDTLCIKSLYLYDAFKHFNDTLGVTYYYGFKDYLHLKGLYFPNLQQLYNQDSKYNIPLADSAWASHYLHGFHVPKKSK